MVFNRKTEISSSFTSFSCERWVFLFFAVVLFGRWMDIHSQPTECVAPIMSQYHLSPSPFRIPDLVRFSFFPFFLQCVIFVPSFFLFLSSSSFFLLLTYDNLPVILMFRWWFSWQCWWYLAWRLSSSRLSSRHPWWCWRKFYFTERPAPASSIDTDLRSAQTAYYCW